MSEATKTQKTNEIKDFRFPPPKRDNVVRIRLGGRIRRSGVLIPIVATAVAYELRHRRIISFNYATGIAVASWSWWYLHDVEGVL